MILSLISNYLCKYDICDFTYRVSNQSSQFSRAAFWLAECAWRYYDLIGRCKIVYYYVNGKKRKYILKKKMATFDLVRKNMLIERSHKNWVENWVIYLICIGHKYSIDGE